MSGTWIGSRSKWRQVTVESGKGAVSQSEQSGQSQNGFIGIICVCLALSTAQYPATNEHQLETRDRRVFSCFAPSHPSYVAILLLQ